MCERGRAPAIRGSGRGRAAAKRRLGRALAMARERGSRSQVTNALRSDSTGERMREHPRRHFASMIDGLIQLAAC